MPNLQKTAGDRTEREALLILGDLLGAGWCRRLGAGIPEDTGDIWHRDVGEMHPSTVVQVTRCKSQPKLSSVAAAKAAASELQRVKAGAKFGATMIRASTSVGVRWRVVLTAAQFDVLGGGVELVKVDALWSASTLIALAPDLVEAAIWVETAGVWVMPPATWATMWREAS